MSGIFFTAIIVSLILPLFTPVGRNPLGVILGSYLITNLTASIRAASKNEWKYFFVLPAVFATLHISYELGFLVGLFRFIHRWGDKEGKVPKINNGIS